MADKQPENRREKGSPAEPSGGKRSDPNPWSGVGRLSTVGLEIGLTVAILSVLGWWLDGQWATSPWLTLTGAAIGIVGTTFKLLRLSASMDRKPPDKPSGQ